MFLKGLVMELVTVRCEDKIITQTLNFLIVTTAALLHPVFFLQEDEGVQLGSSSQLVSSHMQLSELKTEEETCPETKTMRYTHVSHPDNVITTALETKITF